MAIADWLFGDGRAGVFAGVFYLFDADGLRLIAHKFAANIGGVFLSDDARLAAVQCLTNPNNPADSDIFTLYDVRTRSVLWRRPLITSPASAVTFDPDQGFIVTAERYGPITYRIADGATDEIAARELLLHRGDGWTILDLVRDELASGLPDENRARELVGACERAADLLVEHPRASASALRLAGEILEAGGDLGGALKHWDAALGIDPAVGVSKRAAALRARLSGA